MNSVELTGELAQLAEMLMQLSVENRREIADDPYTPRDTLFILLEDPDYNVRFRAACNRNSPYLALKAKRFQKTENLGIRFAATRNFETNRRFDNAHTWSAEEAALQ